MEVEYEHMNKTAGWLGRECKFAGTPMSPTGRGTSGYSRVYDLALRYIENIGGLKTLSKDAHVARFAFSEDAPPEHQLRLSWADFDDEGCPSVKLRIVENTVDRLLQADAATKPGEHVIRTDVLHLSAQEFQVRCYEAYHDLEKKSSRQLSPGAKHGLSLRWIESRPPH